MSAPSPSLLRYRFEVFGRVQGVFFRKHTVVQAKKLNLTGWVANTSAGTVQGEAEGDIDNMNQFKQWLSKTGSPSCRIEKAVFSNERAVVTRQWPDFSQREDIELS